MTVHSIMEGFQPFPKIARLSRECVVTEKIDGTNGQVAVVEHTNHSDEAFDRGAVAVIDGGVADGLAIYAGSRTRWLQPGKSTDNFGFAGWVKDNAAELVKLGPGRHFGEWWGKGIQRGYGLNDRRFSLFNTGRWVDFYRDKEPGDVRQYAPTCCHVVPVLYRGEFSTERVDTELRCLDISGSCAAPGFANPEGIIVYHTAANIMFKRTLEDDESPKAVVAQRKAA